MVLSSALQPVDKIVEQLNAFLPAMLGGYPSNLELLIDEQKAGRLHISPVIIMTGGVYLPDSLRERLSETFHCYVQTAYACTEGGPVACECINRHFHINDDWVITLTDNGKTVKIPPFAIYATLKEVHDLKRFQLVAYLENRMELRIETKEDTRRQAAFEKAERELKFLFKRYGINNVTITMSDDMPKQHPKSGKFKHIVHASI